MNTQQVILITGASSGIGKESALQLIKDGHIVYGAARRVEKMQALVEAGGHAISLDVTDYAQAEKAIAQIVEEQGRIDVLVNNAGYAIYGAVEDTSMEDVQRQFDVNFFGVVKLTQLVLPHMRAQQSGKIINVSSMGGKMYTPLGSFYHATKHALEGWSDCLRLELKDKGIDVVVVEPGAIATEFGDVMTQPMLDRSGAGAYKELTQVLAKATQESYKKPNMASPPSVIANVISKAVKTDRPRTRYAAGKFAKPMMWIRTYLGDRIFDRVVMSQVR